MKKIIYNQYGNSDVLQLIEIPLPTLSKNEILIKVKAVSINPLDWKIFKGDMKLMSGIKFPKGVGIDFSGLVEKVGENIKGFKKGDAVMGILDAFKGNALAEYIVVNENDIISMPRRVSFGQAAASPVVGLSALNILNKLSDVKIRTKILINGASGGIGMFLTQLAKKKGAIVTAVTSSKGIGIVKKWGADTVVNYRTHSILDTNQRYDVVVDLSGQLTFKKAKRLLNPAATFITTLPGLKTMAGSFFNNLFSTTKYKVLVLKPTHADLQALAALISEGLDIVVDKSFPISDTRSAYKTVAQQGLIGKAVITV